MENERNDNIYNNLQDKYSAIRETFQELEDLSTKISKVEAENVRLKGNLGKCQEANKMYNKDLNDSKIIMQNMKGFYDDILSTVNNSLVKVRYIHY